METYERLVHGKDNICTLENEKLYYTAIGV
jgi:hypothetical protein